MDVNQPRLPSAELRKIIHRLQYKKQPIKLVGNAGLASQQHASDYDLFCSIYPVSTPEQAYSEFMRILDRTTKHPDIYFIEGKIQRQDRSKTKFYSSNHHLAGSGLFSYLKSIKTKVSNYFAPSKLNNTSTKTMKDFGGQKIVALNVYRTPIPSMIDTALNFVSLGSWEREKKNVNYDKMFHLALIITLANGKNVVMEKNEVVNISTSYATKTDTETMNVPLKGTSLTLQELFDKARASVPEKTFYDYNAFTNNCQFFIRYILQASGLYSEPIAKFVFQDTIEIIKHLPAYVSTVAKVITRTGAVVNKVLGKGQPRKAGISKPPSQPQLSITDQHAFETAFKNVEYVKLDFIVRLGNVFRELSVIYSFATNTPEPKVIADSLICDIHDYLTEHNHYKALKRLFALYKLQGNAKAQLPLSRVFNSKLGELYSYITNLKALQLLRLHSYTTDKTTKAKVKINLKDMRLNPELSLITQYIAVYEKELEKAAKPIWVKLKPLQGQRVAVASPQGEIASRSLPELRRMVKEHGLSKRIRGYTKMSKEELIQKILKVVDKK